MSYELARPEGTITVSPSALAGLVTTAAESVEGAEVRRGRRRLEIEVDEGNARVRLALEERRELLSCEVPLVEEEERLAARRLSTGRGAHADTSEGRLSSSSVSVDVE